MKKIIYCLPRILSILLIGFISLFALDVFTGAAWLIALLIHLIPSFILIILTIIAWKKGLLGGIIFMILGIIALVKLIWIIAVPTIVIGILYLIADKMQKH